MNVDEAAERLGETPATIEALLKEGKLRAEGDGIDPISVLSLMTDRLGDDMLRASSSNPEPWLAALGVPMSLVLWLLFCFVCLFSLADEPILWPPVMAVVVFGWLGATAALARWGGGLGTSNGMGVTLYGRRKSDAGPIATAWLCAVFVPLVPLRSHIVHREAEHEPTIQGRTTSYQLSPHPLCWPQVVPILVGVWTVVALGVLYLAGAFGG